MFKFKTPTKDERLIYKPIKNKYINNRVLICIILFITLLNGYITPIHKDISFEGKPLNVSQIDFIYDLTYINKDEIIYEQAIFKEQLKLINNAREFIIIDMFLFNDDCKYTSNHPELSKLLTEALILQKKKYPQLKVYFITDEVNNFYGALQSKYIKELKDNNIEVIISNLEILRDPNPLYSGFWRTFIKWFGTSGKGWIPIVVSPNSPKVTLRSYLKFLNFKANHRKIIITEEAAIITSANSQDASGFFSNIAFRVDGEIINDLIKTEAAVAKFSGYEIDELKYENNLKTVDDIKVTLLTESKIKEHLLSEIRNTHEAHKITIGMFYLSDRKIIKELIKASNRGVNVRVILDPNEDSFKLKKNGIPNKQVAYEMINKTNGAIKVKWYDTHGEQYHTKLTFIEKDKESIIIGGSANLTRRNLDDYNLETNIKIKAKNDSDVVNEVLKYFNRLWNNTNGHYTSSYEKYEEYSILKTILYRFQEWSGLCTF